MEDKEEKFEKHVAKLITKIQKIKVTYLDLKVICTRKEYSRQRSPESSCVMKETVDI